MLRVKGQDGFLPLGPELVPAAEFDPTDFTFRTILNGEVVQEATADDLIWAVAYQLADLCRLITLEPGDVILTGTPANSRPMEPGDLVAVEIDGLGRLENTVVDWDVDLAGPGEQLEVSAHTLHVALAIPEDEAERMVAEGRAVMAAAASTTSACGSPTSTRHRRAGVQFGLVERRATPAARCSRATTSRTASSWSRGRARSRPHRVRATSRCSLDDARAHLAAPASSGEEREGSLFLHDPDGRAVQLMPYRRRTEVDAGRSTRARRPRPRRRPTPARSRQLPHGATSTRASPSTRRCSGCASPTGSATRASGSTSTPTTT